MEEYRLDPVDLGFSLVSTEKSGCKECIYNKNELKSIEFKNGYLKIYELKDRVQPSKYELAGQFLKKSNAHGYEEIIVENEKHSPNFRSYNADDIEKLLLVISDRIKDIKKYDIGNNISISRYVDAHDYWDVLVLPVPRHIPEKCFVCENMKNAGNRVVFKTSGVIGYVPFAPKRNEMLKITPVKHTAIDQLDEVIAFEIANFLMKTMKKLRQGITINIMQSGAEHFEINLMVGEIDPVDALGINRINYSPEETAKKLSEELDDGK